MLLYLNKRTIKKLEASFCDASSFFSVSSSEQKNTSTDGYAVLYPSSTSNPYSGAYGYLNEAKTDYYVTDKGIGLAGHELGHVLGLAHVTNKAIMIDNSKDRYDVYKIVKPQSDDVNGINRLY